MSEDLEQRLYGCLASRRWANSVASGWPYGDAHRLVDSAALLMETLTDEEWLEAMRAHPRIGERGGDAPATSESEQSRAMHAAPKTLAELAAENRRYEEKFGHVFLIYASGRTAEDVLGELRRRMNNDAGSELEEAKRELRRIALNRMAKLI